MRAAGSAICCETYRATCWICPSVSCRANDGIWMPPCRTIGATRLAKPAGASGGGGYGSEGTATPPWPAAPWQPEQLAAKMSAPGPAGGTGA